ncbi:dynein heavy chain 2, axonemal-like [Agrilus planipennis]|uniref:Dynein heavy chain 2, axonemal-like n=1 Tax=Agrilus planipennis TaxID=224129 RepID=A0A7F5RH46_AGRPL|nr:dynein heavy chain 2, axonemal-like [Agrilus planipennis]
MTEEKIVIPASVRRRNDSLFSSDSEDAEKTVRIIIPDDEEKEKQVEYSPEEIDKLVSFIMKMTTLYDLRDDDWTEANKEVIKNFFYYVSNMTLTVCFDEHNLLCSLNYPECIFDDLMFFYRDPGEIFQVDTFHDKIHFGTVDYKVEGSILRHIELFYLPIFLKQESWPDSILFRQSVSTIHSHLSSEPWKLNRGHIFNQVDTFIQRCKDMIEVCLAMKDIGRYHEIKVIEERMFGGSKGDEFAGWCTRIELMFQEAFTDLVEVENKITDVNDTSWYDDITKFRTRLKSIDVVIENLVKAVSAEVTHVEEGLEYLASLYYYSKRPLLTHVFNAYIEMAFDDAYWLPHCKYREETFNLYDKCLNLIDEATLNLYRKWVDTIGEDVMERLNRPLLCKSVTRPGLLECNIDRSILPMIRECKIFESLKFEIPANAKFIIDKADSLRNTYECVLQVVLDYNAILSALADEERILFKQLIGTVEKRIQPGLMGLTWSVDEIEDYVAECGAYTAELQDFVDDYKTCNMQIVIICERVCALTIISLTHDSAFTIYELVEEMDRLTRDALTTLIEFYQEIIRYLIVVYEGFENIITLMASHWIKYIMNFDFLLEEAVRICVRNSMQYMYQQLHGDGTVGPNPLLKLEANLRHNRINFEPSLAQVDYVVSDILPGFTRALKGLPRIVDKFNVSDTPVRPFADVIANDGECKRLQELMNNEVQVNVQQMQNYLSIWEPFRDMWEVDKDRFIERYEKENPNAAQFDANIGRYTEVANNVQIQETISNVHFIVVNSTELKKSIVEHCFLWQEKLCKLLHDMTVEKIDAIYDYVELYSELVMKRPETLDDLGVAEVLQARLRMEVPLQEAQFPLIFDQLITLDKYKVEVSDVVRNRAKGISVLWSSYLEILDDAEKMLGYAKEDFKTELLKEAEDLQKDRVQLLEVFLETGPFSSSINPKDALKYLSGIRAQLKLIREREDRLRRDLGIFDISLPESIELKRLEQEDFKTELLKEAEDLQKDRVQLLEVFLETGPFSSSINPKDALKYLSGIRAQLKLIREREDRLRRDLGIFDISLPESIELKRLEQELATLEYVWDLADEWETAWESYKSGGFWTIQTTEMEDKAQTLFRKLNRLSRELKDKGWDIVFVTRDKVDAFRRVLPLIGDLKNPAMRSRHWDRVRKTVGKDFDENSSDFNLEAIIAMEFQNYAEDINEISNAATMELQIERGLEAIALIWKTMTIEMVPHERKGLYRIKSVDECFQILEENMTQLSTMKSTRFVEPFAREVDYWERALSYIMEVCECALLVQRQWLYLENIFSGEDIRKQLPLEADRFDMITSEWTDTTIVLAETRTILEAVHYKPPPYLLDKLNKMNDKLELIQRALEQYLETKRHIFPRFYFISNDDMLEILGNSKKPELVQPHLKKLFDNLNKLKTQKGREALFSHMLYYILVVDDVQKNMGVAQ